MRAAFDTRRQPEYMYLRQLPRTNPYMTIFVLAMFPFWQSPAALRVSDSNPSQAKPRLAIRRQLSELPWQLSNELPAQIGRCQLQLSPHHPEQQRPPDDNEFNIALCPPRGRAGDLGLELVLLLLPAHWHRRRRSMAADFDCDASCEDDG